jgi:hypothetical protein
MEYLEKILVNNLLSLISPSIKIGFPPDIVEISPSLSRLEFERLSTPTTSKEPSKSSTQVCEPMYPVAPVKRIIASKAALLIYKY